MSGKDVMDKYKNTFFLEFEDIRKILQENITRLEASPNDMECVATVFRQMHTLKGNVSFFGFKTLQEISHRLEDLLSQVRSRTITIDAEKIGLLWEGLSLIDKEMAAIKKGKGGAPESARVADFCQKVAACLAVAQKKEGDIPHRQDDVCGYRLGGRDITRSVYIIQDFLERIEIGRGVDEIRVEKFHHAIKDVADVFTQNKSPEQARLLSKMAHDYDTMVDDAGRANEFLYKHLQTDFQEVLKSVEMVSLAPREEEKRDIAAPLPEKARDKSSFRIEEEAVNDVIEAVRGLEQNLNIFTRLTEKLGEANVPPELVSETKKAVNHLSLTYQDILRRLIKISSSSPRPLLDKIEGLCQNLANSCRRKVVVSTKAEDIFVERPILEALEQILLHVVRNCIDHGIESPEERKKVGKDEVGKVYVDVSQQNGSLVVAVGDDGRGINFQNLRAVAFKQGLITAEQVTSLSDEESAKLLFQHGLTTSEDANSVSGRGMGMNVVYEATRKAGGVIEVKSKQGEGTSFVLRFPRKGQPAH